LADYFQQLLDGDFATLRCCFNRGGQLLNGSLESLDFDLGQKGTDWSANKRHCGHRCGGESSMSDDPAPRAVSVTDGSVQLSRQSTLTDRGSGDHWAFCVGLGKSARAATTLACKSTALTKLARNRPVE